MLLNVGEGVILDALLKLGFTCTHDDVDLARLEHIEQPYLIKVDVTRQLAQRDDQTSALPYVPPLWLTAPLAWLHHQLSKVNCQYDFEAFRADQSEAVFVRHDTVTIPRLGRVTMKVIVRARAERVPKAEA